MDPNETLKRIRLLAECLTDPGMGSPASVKLQWAAEMAEAFEALDHWLTHKGFLPSAWERKQ